MAEEALTLSNNEKLRAVLVRQPPWSDLPVLVLTRSGADSAEARAATRSLGNVTLLERPMRGATLVSTVRTAIRARQRQYQIRGYIEDRVRAENALRLADQRKDEFLATLGHELRNPLAPLVTASQLLKLANLRDPVAAQVSEIMERQVGHLIRLVEDLLEVSRITRGVIEVRCEPVDLGSVVRAAVETSRPLLDTAQHDLKVDLPAEPITVAGDPVRLTQVFTNLITNAAKYTSRGGRIVVAITKRGERVAVSGPGQRDRHTGVIPRVGIRHVHPGEPVRGQDAGRARHRADARAQPRGHAWGMCRGAQCWQQRRKRIHRRAAHHGRGRVPGPRNRPSPSGSPRTASWWSMTTVMRPRRWARCSRPSGRRCRWPMMGLRPLPRSRISIPTLSCSTLACPGWTGMRFLAGSGRRQSTPEVLLIALTGWGQEQDRRRSQEAGFDYHLVKPPDVNRLHELVTSTLLTRQRRGEGAA